VLIQVSFVVVKLGISAFPGILIGTEVARWPNGHKL